MLSSVLRVIGPSLGDACSVAVGPRGEICLGWRGLEASATDASSTSKHVVSSVTLPTETCFNRRAARSKEEKSLDRRFEERRMKDEDRGRETVGLCS